MKLPRLVRFIAAILIALTFACEPPRPSLAEGEGEGDPSDVVLVATPAECDFGEVSLGTPAFCDVTLSNGGTRDVAFGVSTINADAPDEFGVIDVAGATLSPGDTRVVRVAAGPVDVGVTTGTLELRDVDAALLLTLPLTVLVTAPPTCIVRIASVNGVLAGASVPAIHVLDDVVLSLAGSEAAAGHTITSYEWNVPLSGRPPGSTVQLTSPQGVETRYTFGTSNGLDVAGSYSVTASVFDDAGQWATCDTFTITTTPADQGVSVQLTFNETDALDLHLRRDEDTLCSSLDCYAATCTGDGLTWDEASVVMATSAFGPSIHADNLANGIYRVTVDARATSSATLRMYVDGRIVFEAAKTVEAGDAWLGATITCGDGPSSCEVTAENDTVIGGACAP